MIRKSFWVPTLDMVADGLMKDIDNQEPLRKLTRGEWQSSGTFALAPTLWAVVQEITHITVEACDVSTTRSIAQAL
eukprot:11324291-Heterocapsa_arctica.AAC.1